MEYSLTDMEKQSNGLVNVLILILMEYSLTNYYKKMKIFRKKS